AFGDVLERELGVPALAVPTAGSSENLRLIDRGRMHFAIGAANNLHPAWYGEGTYSEQEYRSFRILFYIAPNAVTFAALRSSGLNTVRDLVGKRVGVGTDPTTWD